MFKCCYRFNVDVNHKSEKNVYGFKNAALIMVKLQNN